MKQEIQELKDGGLTCYAIAKETGLAQSTVYYRLNKKNRDYQRDYYKSKKGKAVQKASREKIETYIAKPKSK